LPSPARVRSSYIVRRHNGIDSSVSHWYCNLLMRRDPLCQPANAAADRQHTDGGEDDWQTRYDPVRARQDDDT